MNFQCPACDAPMPEEAAVRGRDRLHGTRGTFEVVACGRCGSGRTLPLASPEELSAFYPSSYGAHSFPTQRADRLLASLLFRWRYWRGLGKPPLNALRRLPCGQLLDVGSGRGDLGVVLQQRGWSVVGLEPSEEASEEARRRGVETEVGTLTVGTALPAGRFDAVVMEHSLEHVVEPADDLAVVHSCLRDDGLLLVSVPNFASWQRKRFGTYWLHLDLPRHRSHFSPRGLELLLRRCGFSIIELGSSSSTDGLPISLEYRLFGDRRLGRGASRYAGGMIRIGLAPLTLALDRLAGQGDVLHAIAVKRAHSAGAQT